MQPAGPRSNEADSLAALHALQVLDSGPEEEFDALVRSAALICGVPVSLISLIDADRQWFKANIGLPGVTETPRDLAFCAHAILGEDVFEVPDAAQDPRFADNPLVTTEPNIRFYAGAPVCLKSGHRIGTLCIIDRQPRVLNDTQREALQCLALAAARSLEGRRTSKMLHELMQTSEDQLRRLYEATPAMLHSIDDQGRLLAVSDMWLNKLGYTRDEVMGRPSTDFLSPQSQAYAREVVLPRFFATGRCDGVDYQMVKRDGELLEVLLSAMLERDADGSPVRSLAVSEDVTLRRQAERRLKDEQRRLANIIDGTDVGTWEWHVPTGDWRLNDRFVQIAGQSPDESMSAMPLTTHVHPDDLAPCERLLQQHFDKQSVRYECEVRVRHRAGHWVWVKDRGRVTSWTGDGAPEWMFGTRRDITERKQQEDALVKSQGQLKAVTDNMPALISYIDRDHRFRFANLAYKTWLEMEPASLIGQSLLSLYGEAAYAKIKPFVDRALGGETLSYERDIDTPRAKRHMHVTMTPHWDKAGDVVGLYVLMNDITAQKQAEQQLAISQERLMLAVEGSHLALFDWDLPTNQVYHSAQWSSMLGGPAIETTTSLQALSDLVHPEDLPGVLLKVSDAVKGITPFYRAEHRVCTRSGDWLWILSRGRVVERDANGRARRLSGTNADISEQKGLEAQLQRMAEIDHLTNLPNRALFHDRLQHAFKRMQRNGTPMALLLLDIDHFKGINDSCGHDAGDAVLQEVAKRLAHCVRKTDTVARLGGDEFTIILEVLHAPDEAEMIAAKVVASVAEPFVHAGESLRFTTSIGLAFLDRPDEPMAALIKRADQALYRAKVAGRNRYHRAEPFVGT